MYFPAPSILITDDDLQFRETLRGVFEPRGFNTLLAQNGEEALDVIKRCQVHLLLLDMHMPKLTGLETIRRVKRIHAELPCILMSAALDDGLIQEAISERAFCVLSKPVSGRQLTSSVQKALQEVYNWPNSER
ncbi:MAG TPA: response regulator [Pirellulales bacterium]|jgi:CheY-like chemotaxis protein|nr:response regulator [Pirellulales bacterium]